MTSLLDYLRHLRNRPTSMDEVCIVYETLTAMDRLSSVTSRPLMIDVGAQYGSSLQRFLNQGWEVHAFEPDHDNRKKLIDRFNKSDLLTVSSKAVSDQMRGSVPFYRSTESTGISGLSSFHSSHTKDGTVETIPLSQYTQEAGIDRVDFLKVDAEGHDLFVLKGFPWNKHRPKFVICEFENPKTLEYGYDFYDLADYMRQKGYNIVVSEWYPIKEYGIKHNWNTYRQYPCDLKNSNAWGNLICAKNKNIYRLLLRRLRIFLAKNLFTRFLNLV